MSNQDVKDYYSPELQIIAAEYLKFDFENGEIYWKKQRGSRGKAGSRAGTVQTNPETGKQYRNIKINKKNYREHRLLYCFYHKCSFEGLVIDHLNQDSLDNRIENLEAKTDSGNGRNCLEHKSNTSGFTGVSWAKQRQKWYAQICVDSKTINLGYFTKKRDAIFRRRLAEIHYGFSKDHGRKPGEPLRPERPTVPATPERTPPVSVPHNPFLSLPLFSNI